MLASREELDAAFSYNPVTGELRWREGRQRAGKLAGRINHNGYVTVDFKGRQYRGHRIAWFLTYGEWPPETIDHINGDPADNRLANLRLATVKQNLFNRTARPSALGLKGVSPHHGGKYRASIGLNGKKIHLGQFDTPEAAHQAYIAAAKKHFGEFARFN